LRDWFETDSVILWMFFGCPSGATRTTLEHFPNNTRTSVEQSSGIIRWIDGKRPSIHFFWHGKPISMKILHVLIGLMFSNNLKIKRTDLPFYRKKENMTKIILQDWKVNANFRLLRKKYRY